MFIHGGTTARCKFEGFVRSTPCGTGDLRTVELTFLLYERCVTKGQVLGSLLQIKRYYFLRNP